MGYLITLSMYLSILLGYYWFSKKDRSTFVTTNSWWKNGLSLFAVQFSITTPLLMSGVIHSEGISGMWLYWAVFIISGFSPFVFAPLWSKLNFITDNQFTRYRFSGFSAKCLHVFRTVYVGWFIVSFLISFQLLAFLKVLMFFTGLESNYCLVIVSVLMLISIIKNKVGLNIRLDTINTLIIAVVFITVFISLSYNYTPSSRQESNLFSTVLPSNLNHLWIYFFIQNISVSLFDGSGIEAQRFFSTKNTNNVWKMASLSVVLHLLFTLLIVFIIYFGIHQNNFNSGVDDEIKILYYFKNSLKSWMHPLILLSFFAVFITSFSGLLNWGSSYLSIDLYKTYFRPTSNNLNVAAYFCMLVICCTSLAFTYFSNSLQDLIKVFFSISAGVAPVFVLRWFWFKINAWTQIAAMISSGIYTLIYQFYVSKSQLELSIINHLELTPYTLQLLAVSSFTIITWLFVAIITPFDNPHKLEDFKRTVLKDYYLFPSLTKAIVFGIVVTSILYLTLLLL